MTKISSSIVWFYKWVFPAFWFGFLALFVALIVADGGGKGLAPFILVPIAFGVFGYVLMKKFLWDLLDEVYDCGDALQVRKGADEERIPLSNIMNVSAPFNVNPPRIALRLVTPGKLGAEIAFIPVQSFSLNPFAKNKIAEDLIVRVDQARRAG